MLTGRPVFQSVFSGSIGNQRYSQPSGTQFPTVGNDIPGRGGPGCPRAGLVESGARPAGRGPQGPGILHAQAGPEALHTK